MTTQEAADYHHPQIEIFRETGADLVTAMTINYVQEAIGIVRAAQSADMPVVISFTLETDGYLSTGQSLKEAILQVDVTTNQAAAYYMINCAHPTHFAATLSSGESWLDRIRGIRINASRKSHADLNEAEALDEGNPAELGSQLRDFRATLKHLNILGGCCGTDDRRIEAICKACLPVLWTHLSVLSQELPMTSDLHHSHQSMQKLQRLIQ